VILAVDTATQFASLALYDPAHRQVRAEEVWRSNRMHTAELMPRLVRMMEQQGVSPSHLNGLVVGLGPGSFTGVRIGLSVVKGIALARGLPVVGIPTLEVVAYPHTAQPLPIWAALQAGRGRLCVGNYVRRRGRWRLNGAYQLVTVEGLCTLVEKPALLCGELAAEAASIRAHLGPEVTIAAATALPHRAAHMAELGWQRLAQGHADNAASLSPIYLHPPLADRE